MTRPASRLSGLVNSTKRQDMHTNTSSKDQNTALTGSSARFGFGRKTSAAISAVVAVAVSVGFAVAAGPASGAFGDGFDFASVNAPGAQTAPAFPGNKAFWAGVCDRGIAPGFGEPIGGEGVGSIPPTVPMPGPDGTTQIQTPAAVTPEHCIDWGAVPPSSSPNIWEVAPSWRLDAVRQAGSHPDGSATFWFKGGTSPDGTLDNIYVDLPPGVVGNPNAVPKCTGEQFAVRPLECPAHTQVGVLRLYLKGSGTGNTYRNTSVAEQTIPIYNLEPRKGKTAELGMGYISGQGGQQGEGVVTARLVAKARTNGDFGVTTFIGQIPAALPIFSQAVTLWGVPWDAINDVWRPDMSQGNPPAGCTLHPYGGHTPDCQVHYDPSWGPIRPFLTTETDCNPAPVTTAWVDVYQRPGAFSAEGDPVLSAANPADEPWTVATSQSPSITGCASLPFAPSIDFRPTSSAADGASGLAVDLSIPQNNDSPASVAADPGLPRDHPDFDPAGGAPGHWRSAAGRATAHLKDTVVTLPAGVSVNPSAATGLQACPDGVVGVRQLGSPPLFNNVDPADGLGGDDCPDGSRLGTASVVTPLLEERLTGDVILGEPKSTDSASGEMFRLFLVLRNKERGLVAKIYGSTVADPSTGRLTATFANNPELPFSDLRLDFKGGDRGLLALPQACGNPGWESTFTPWSAAHGGGGQPVEDGGAFNVDARCGLGFSPTLAAGMDSRTARGSGTFSFQFTRPEGQQYARGLTAQLPQGLLASVKDVPLCSNAAADAGACPAGSKIGLVDAKAGSGDPFVLEQKGEVFLTEGYKGGEYGLAVKIRPIAGPFRGAMELSPIVVRQAIHVDRKTAQVTAVSDPLPLIHHGVPLRVREVTVLIDRGGFMLNPSDCATKQVAATLTSDQGASAGLANGFQAAGCKSLAFKPKLALRLTGRKQVRTGKHPGIRAVVTQKGVPEAGIEKAEVRLPKSLALDVDNAQALCEYEDGTKPDLENHCPKGSIVGRSRAVSPLLNRPLVGNVYFVKNVRRSSSGNLIRTLPMIVVALRGEIAVNLVGESNVKKGKLVNTFDQVPDAPITRFNLNINGGKNGIIAVTRTRRSLINLCASKRQIAEADIDGHNGRRYDRDIRMKTPCAKKSKKSKAQKRKAAKRKAAAKRRAARR
jgi:hypothetical protein